MTDSSLDGLCPRCLVRDAPAPNEDALRWEDPPTAERPASGISGADSPGRSFGDYELLEEIARGGMGVVYKGWQKSLQRLVAIKIIRLEQAGPDSAERLTSEAKAVACLQHPHIVGVHEVGRLDNQHYLTMDYVEGCNLHQLCAKEPLAPRRSARFVKTIAEAIHYAHQQGVLHRDLKPSNVLVDPFDQLHITDFGLAKSLTTDAQLTLSGQTLGTPQYMPPEQASIHHGQVGPWSDVYSIGGILYHLLTGRPPFVGGQVGDVLQQVLSSDPASPRLLNPSVPRDLETICLKCLEKDPRGRYATAGQLAEELDRYLADRPIQARAASYLERAGRWCHRRPLIASLLLALVVTLATGMSGIVWQWQRAIAGELQARRNAYAGDMVLVQQALAEGDWGRARTFLDRQRPTIGQMDLRGWEWRYRWQQCQRDPSFRRSLFQHQSAVQTVSLSADGQWLALGGSDGMVVLVETASGRTRVLQQTSGTSAVVAFSPAVDVLAFTQSDGSRATSYVDTAQGKIKFWDVTAGRELFAIDHAARILALAFSPDGRFLAASTTSATTDETIKVWELPGDQLRSSESRLIMDLRVSSEWSKVDLTQVSNHSTGASLYAAFDGPLAISPRGDLLTYGDVTGRVHVLEFPRGENRLLFPAHDGFVTALAFSPDGRMLATAAGYSDSSIRLWSMETGNAMGQPLAGHQRYIHDLKFSPDGKVLASASADQSIRLWKMPSGRDGGLIRGHCQELLALAFLPDGKGLVSGAKDGAVWRWNLMPQRSSRPAASTAAGIWQWAFLPDGKTGAAVTIDGSVQLWNLAEMQAQETIHELGRDNWMASASPDGRFLAVGDRHGAVKVWDLHQRRMRRKLDVAGDKAVVFAKFTSHGSRLTAAGLDSDGQVIQWDTATWKPTASWSFGCLLVTGDFSSSGRFVFGGCVDGETRILTIRRQNERRLARSTGLVTGAAFSPDETVLATGDDQGNLTCWNTRTWQPMGSAVRGHRLGIYSVAFSPDGQRIATAGASGEEAVLLWDLAVRRTVATLEGRGSRFIWASFSPDGNTIVAIARDSGTMHLWRAPAWTEITAAEDDASVGSWVKGG